MAAVDFRDRPFAGPLYLTASALVPELRIEQDGDRLVLAVAGWHTVQLNALPNGVYLGPSGYVTDAAEAVNIRGADGKPAMIGVGPDTAYMLDPATGDIFEQNPGGL